MSQLFENGATASLQQNVFENYQSDKPFTYTNLTFYHIKGRLQASQQVRCN